MVVPSRRCMVDVAQLVEPRVVIPVVVGSSPIVHPRMSAEIEGEDPILPGKHDDHAKH